MVDDVGSNVSEIASVPCKMNDFVEVGVGNVFGGRFQKASDEAVADPDGGEEKGVAAFTKVDDTLLIKRFGIEFDLKPSAVD